jgi:hypothetical protein
MMGRFLSNGCACDSWDFSVEKPLIAAQLARWRDNSVRPRTAA